MVQQNMTLDKATAAGPERLSALWWLVLPVVAALILLVTGHAAPDFYALWIASESRGLLELSQILLLLAGFILGLRMLTMAALRGRRLLWLWVLFATLACFYIAGEEASWGQHYLDWATPEGWSRINDQGETNLHNTSSWFDQKPRLLLELGIILGGIGAPLLAFWRPEIRRAPWAVILPTMVCLPSALLAEISRMAERLLALAGSQAFLFYRASEVQEFYFYLFMLLYLVDLRRRLTAAKAGQP